MSDTSMANKSMLRRAAGNLIAIAVGLAVAVGLAELVVRVAFRGSVDFDVEMWKYATQIKRPSDDPRVVFEHRPDGSALLMGVKVTTNSLGLREGERTREKPAGTYRIVALGDSITMGWGVAQDMTYPAQLERKLNAQPPKGFPAGLRYEVLNLGVGNYNTVQEVMRLRNLGLALDPDLIILGYFINDAEPTPKPSRGFLIEQSYLYAFIASRVRLFKPSTGTYLDYYRGLYADGAPGWQAAQAALRDLATISRDRSIPAMMFIIPEMHELGDGYPFAGVHRQLEQVGSAVGLPVVDLFPALRGQKPESALWVSPLDAHHNAKAQGLMADGMYAALEARAADIQKRDATRKPGENGAGAAGR
jgi:lysophospholipase L1-like esterase